MPPSAAGSGPACGDLAADAGERLGFPPRVRFSGPVDTVVDRERREQLLAVLRESLSNVIRHAAASTVEVEVTAGHELVLRVTDDGQGASSDWGEGFGLRNMASRAAELGGSFALGDQHAPGHHFAVAGTAGRLPRQQSDCRTVIATTRRRSSSWNRSS